MDKKIKFIYADQSRSNINISDKFIPLDTYGTQLDLKRHNIKFQEGKKYYFYDLDEDSKGDYDPIIFNGIVHFSDEAKIWYVEVDQKSSGHYSDMLDINKYYSVKDIVDPSIFK